MTDSTDNNVWANFARMFGGGSPDVMELAVELLDVLHDLGNLLIELDNDVDQAAADEDALAIWSDTSPEARSAILLNLAWQTRENYQPAGESTGADYAGALHRYAADFTGDDMAFHGNAFPAMPLPAQAGALSTSIGFDRDDLPISLEIVLLFLAAVNTHQPQ